MGWAKQQLADEEARRKVAQLHLVDEEVLVECPVHEDVVLHNYGDLDGAKRSARQRMKRGEPGFDVFEGDPKLLDEAIDAAHADAAIDCGSCPGDDD